MNPFFFGRADRPLFGLYTPARAGAPAARSVLLCYPAGPEYMRAHRAFRQLNTLLNRAGMNVLRFDYSCTGDSGGDGTEATYGDWLSDIGVAIDELKDNSMVDTVDVVGLRWGATLAVQACRDREDVDRLIMWDPIVSGRAYLDAHLGETRPTGTIGIEGFPFSQVLREAMDGVDLVANLDAVKPAVALVVAEDRPEYRALKSTLDRVAGSSDFEVAVSSGDWAQADPFGDALIPQQIIQAIVDRLQTQVVS
ncbi:MAG: hypothetical protein WD342_01020 [Verrucomicrobiales bacterium]